ncbi:MAG: DUF6249 domain-containing protein [Paludibacteraceae bacterium]
MKKIGFILCTIMLWMGINAQQTNQTATKADTSKTEIGNDSLPKLYLSDDLDPKEAVLLQKLTSNQIMELEKQRLANAKASDMPFNPLGLVVICFATFLLVVFIILMTSRYKNKESIRKHELFMKAIEAGQTIPENYYRENEKSKSTNLQKGAIWMAVGLGAVLSGLLVHKDQLLIVGIIPAFIGVAFLFVHWSQSLVETMHFQCKTFSFYKFFIKE